MSGINRNLGWCANRRIIGSMPDPTPTDSMLVINGQYVSPARPELFCLQSEANFLIQLMQHEGAIPATAKAFAWDEPGTLGPILYGPDGRRVYVIRWSEPNPQGIMTDFMPNAGQLLYEFQNFPLGHGDWRKSFSEQEVRRVGLQGPVFDNNGRVGQTFVVD